MQQQDSRTDGSRPRHRADASNIAAGVPLPTPASPTAKLRQDFEIWAKATGRAADFRLLLRLVLLEPGFQLSLSLRLQEMLIQLPLAGRPLRRLLWYATKIWHGCHISTEARFGGGLYLPHPTGIVIGAGSIIGRDVTIYQQVTLGRRDPDIPGVPCIGDDCRLSAGAKILGPIRLGDGVTVGANAVVLTDVPSGHVAVGVPARILAPAADSLP